MLEYFILFYFIFNFCLISYAFLLVTFSLGSFKHVILKLLHSLQFYTYESLKQMMLPSLKPGAQPNTIETVCPSSQCVIILLKPAVPLASANINLFQHSSKRLMQDLLIYYCS